MMLPPPPDVAAVRAWAGEKGLAEGTVRVRGLTAEWAALRPSAKYVRVVSEDGTLALPLQKLDGGVWTASKELPHGTGLRWFLESDGARDGNPKQLEAYVPHPEMTVQPGVARGEIISMPPFRSKIFPGTTRDWWVYVPKGYDPSQPAPTAYFCDGQWARGYTLAYDNLIAKGDLPPTIVVGINPGERDGGGSNRSYEYDTVSDEYARFLYEEIRPVVEARWRVRSEPESRLVAGGSSGGICAFKSAFLHPEWFGRVISWIGSYVNLQPGASGVAGGHNVHAMVRRQDRKPMRVFLAEGRNDLDNPFGNWPLSNREMAAALKYRDYDYWYVEGNGFHSDAHLRSLLPDALRWVNWP